MHCNDDATCWDLGRTWMPRPKTLCGYAIFGISLYGGNESALWARHSGLIFEIFHMAVAQALPQPPSFQRNAEELPGSKVSASGASRKSARVESPLESCPLQLTSLLISNNHVGTFLRFSISNPPFPTTAATPFATVHQLCSSLPSIFRQRFSSQDRIQQLHSTAPSVARTSLLSRGRPKSTPVLLPLATAMPPKAGRKRSSVGVAQRSGGVQRMFASLMSLRAQTNRNISGRPGTPREEEEIPARDTGVKRDSTIPEQHRPFGCQASIRATGGLSHCASPDLCTDSKCRSEKLRYNTDRKARSSGGSPRPSKLSKNPPKPS